MQGLQIVTPSTHARQRLTPGRPSRAFVRAEAEFAIAAVDKLLAGGEAARRQGTWKPCGANNFADYGWLADYEDIVAGRR
jgi:hypothetical protein